MNATQRYGNKKAYRERDTDPGSQSLEKKNERGASCSVPKAQGEGEKT